jgi:hypothetical protein
MVTLVTFVPTVPVGVAEFPLSKFALGLSKIGLVNVLLVSVSVPFKVDNVPVVGKVTDVASVDVNVVGNAPAVVKLPPKVTVLPVLATPVPPLAPGNIPITPVARGNPVAPVKTAVEAAGPTGP